MWTPPPRLRRRSQEDKFSYPESARGSAPQGNLGSPATSTPPHAPIPCPRPRLLPWRQRAKRGEGRNRSPSRKPRRRRHAAAAATHGDGYAIQVAALREPAEADTIAKRLVSKGYDAYVLTPPAARRTSIACGWARSKPAGTPNRPPRSCNRKNSSNPGSLADAFDRLHAGGSRLPARRVRPYPVRTVNRDQARDRRSGKLRLGQEPEADGRRVEAGDRRPRDA